MRWIKWSSWIPLLIVLGIIVVNTIIGRYPAEPILLAVTLVFVTLFGIRGSSSNG